MDKIREFYLQPCACRAIVCVPTDNDKNTHLYAHLSRHKNHYPAMLLSHYQKNDQRIQTLSQTTLGFNTHLKQCLASPYTIMDILDQLIDSLQTRQSFETYMCQLHQQAYLEADDYSVAVFSPKHGAVE